MFLLQNEPQQKKMIFIQNESYENKCVSITRTNPNKQNVYYKTNPNKENVFLLQNES